MLIHTIVIPCEGYILHAIIAATIANRSRRVTSSFYRIRMIILRSFAAVTVE